MGASVRTALAGAIAVLVVATLVIALPLCDSSVAQAEAAAVLSVHPTSGGVGSVVTFGITGFRPNACGEIVFAPAGRADSGTAVGSYHEAIVPGFVGTSPAVPVRPGRYQFAVSCENSSVGSGFVTYRAPFTVTSDTMATSRFVGMATTRDGKGYWLAQAGGGIYSFGGAAFHGSLPAGPGGLGVKPAAPITGIAATPDGGGYWLVGADGGVFGFGDAAFFGSLPHQHIAPNAPIVGIVATLDGRGYWLLGADGGVFAFGDAPYCTPILVSSVGIIPEGYATGSLPEVAISADPSSVGYAEVDNVASGIIAPWSDEDCEPDTPNSNFAQFFLTVALDASISGIATSSSGAPWIVGIDGGVFTPQVIPSGSSTLVPTAPFYGSLPGLRILPKAPIVGIVATPDRHGYWLVGADGAVFALGDARFYGSAGGMNLPW